MALLIEEKFKHNARELWQFYGGPGEFRTWFKQIVDVYELKEDVDYLLKKIDRQSRYGQPRKEAFLTERALRRVQLGYGREKKEVQAMIVDQTIAIDELLRNPRRLAQVFLAYADTKDKLDLLHHSDCMLTMQEIAKDLGYESARSLNDILVKAGYMYRDKSGRAMPRANKIPSECYSIKAQETPDGRVFNCLKWTFKGKEWVAGVLQKINGMGKDYELQN